MLLPLSVVLVVDDVLYCLSFLLLFLILLMAAVVAVVVFVVIVVVAVGRLLLSLDGVVAVVG